MITRPVFSSSTRCQVVIGVLLLAANFAPAQTPADSVPPTPATNAPPSAPAPTSPTTPPPKVVLPADVPSVMHPTGEAHLRTFHERALAQLKLHPKTQLVFVGDSITQRWSIPEAVPIWNKYYSQYDPINLGDGGDYTEHVLWRIENGELDGIAPKVVVVLVGVNNLYHNPGNTPEETAAGITKIVDTIHQKLPDAKVLLLGVFPYHRAATSLDQAQAVNAIISKLDDGQKTRYLSIWNQFLVDGAVSRNYTSDLLHPNAAGYQVWADNMQPLLQEMMK